MGSCWLLFCTTCHPTFTGPFVLIVALMGEVVSSSPENPGGMDFRSQSSKVRNELVVEISLDNMPLHSPSDRLGNAREGKDLNQKKPGLLPRESLNISGIPGPGFLPIAELFLWSILKYITSLCLSVFRACVTLVPCLGRGQLALRETEQEAFPHS